MTANSVDPETRSALDARGDNTGQEPLIVLVGAGLVGSCFATSMLGKMLIIDPDTFSERQKILACASKPGTLKVSAVASYRDSHSLGHSLPLPIRFQMLGKAFWEWASIQNAIIIDATDGDESSFALSQTALTHGLPVIMSKVHGNAGFVRVFPVSSQVGFCCMGFQRARAEASCFGVSVNAGDVPSTNASLSIAYTVAGIASGAAIRSVKAEEQAYEIRIDLNGLTWTRSRLSMEPCQHHPTHNGADQRVVLQRDSTQLTLYDMMLKASDHLGEDFRLKLQFPLAKALRCADCGRVVSDAWHLVGARTYRCQQCDSIHIETLPSNLWQGRTLTPQQVMENGMANVSLIELGAPYWEIYRFESKHKALDVEVGDRDLVMGGLQNGRS